MARPIAGAPLLVRQLEWLHSCGVTRVAINRVSRDPLPSELHAATLERVGLSVTWIPTAEPLDAAELARRLGAREFPVIVLSPTVLGAADLRAPVDTARETGQDVIVTYESCEVEIRHLGKVAPNPLRVTAPRWMEAISSEALAQRLTEALLRKERDGVEIRGTEVSPGIWRSRGAVVVDGARVEPPVLLGPSCFVSDDVVLGPGAIVGEHAVIEAGARIVHARIAPGVVVGQRVAVENACATPGHIARHAGRNVVIDDPLLVGRARSRGVASRVLAGFALSAVAPAAALFGSDATRVVRRLARVVDGSGQWFGVRDGTDGDAVVLNVLPLLIPPDAQAEEMVAAKAVYQRTKTVALDAKLLIGLIVGASSGTGSDRA
jgi:NDP-sugar pyrophosphorylase family protein